MTQITITEALAELKLIKSKIEKKKVFILGNVGRQEGAKDQMEKDGGTNAVLKSTMQAVNDLQERYVKIRSAIATANAGSIVEILSIKRSIADWLVWRREVAPMAKDLERHIMSGIQQVKGAATKQGFQVVSQNQPAQKPTDVIIEIDEKELADNSEKLQEILDTLDGKLSLHNATVNVEV